MLVSESKPNHESPFCLNSAPLRYNLLLLDVHCNAEVESDTQVLRHVGISRFNKARNANMVQLTMNY